MSKMPVLARTYWWVVICLGVAAACLSQTLRFPTLLGSRSELVSFAILALLFGGKKFVLTRPQEGDETMSMTLGFAITFAALMRQGPGFAVPVSMLCCLSSCLYPKRQRLYQLVFNVSLSAIEALVGGVAFVFLNGWSLSLEPAKTFAAVAGSCACFFATNTFGVSTMISLYTKEKIVPIWKENFAWTAPTYFASACIGALAMIIFHGSSAAIFLLCMPVAYVVYQSFANYVARMEENKTHIEQLQAKQAELAHLYLATIESLALAIDAKDQYTHQHIVRVQRYAVAIAEQMGIEGDELQGIRTGALLHDIGKLGVPEYVLVKPGALTSEEFEQIKKHPEIGAAILDPVVFPWPVLPAVKHHHERWDGSGYPDGLAAEDIPLSARIMAVADVYDAVTSTRSYRGARSHTQAIDIIRNGAGKEFDPTVVEAFLAVIEGVVTEMATEGVGPLIPSISAFIEAAQSPDAIPDLLPGLPRDRAAAHLDRLREATLAPHTRRSRNESPVTVSATGNKVASP